MNDQGVHTPHPAEDTSESVFLGSTMFGAIAGAIAAVVGSAQLLGTAYPEAFAVVGGVLGTTLFGTLGATVLGPACAALQHRRHAAAEAHPADAPMPLID